MNVFIYIWYYFIMWSNITRNNKFLNNAMWTTKIYKILSRNFLTCENPFVCERLKTDTASQTFDFRILAAFITAALNIC